MKNPSLYLLFLLMGCTKTDRFCDTRGSDYEIDIITDIEYTTGLFLDLYQPKASITHLRPIVILAHGMGDTKETKDLTFHCERLASKGLIVASVGWSAPAPFTIDTTLYFQTGVQPIVDLHRAIAFFLHDSRKENQYGIDSSYLFIGGSSFGAITAMHMGFADSLQEFPVDFREDLEQNGIDNQLWRVHQKKVRGVINFAGWMWDTAYIDPDDPGLISIYGESDPLIPFMTDTAVINDVNIMVVSGPGSIHKNLDEMRITNDLMVIPDGGHVAYYEKNWRDSVAARVSEFVGALVCGEK